MFAELEHVCPFFGPRGDTLKARAKISVPKVRKKPCAVVVCLEGLSQLRDETDNGRKWFCANSNHLIFVTPKSRGWYEAGVLTEQDGRKLFDVDALWYLIQTSILKAEHDFGAGTVDFGRIFVTGLSLGGEAALNLAATPGVGRNFAGVAPCACRGHDHLVFTEAALAEFCGLPVWGVQMATDKAEYRMDQMLEFLGVYGGYLFSEGSASPTAGGPRGVQEDGGDSIPDEEVLSFYAEEDKEVMQLPQKSREVVEYPGKAVDEGQWTRRPVWEYYREIRKTRYGKSIELWTIWDSRCDTWTSWQDSVKHHDCWTAAWREGLGHEKRTFGTWCAGIPSNPRTRLIPGEISLQVYMRIPPTRHALVVGETSEQCPSESASTCCPLSDYPASPLEGEGGEEQKPLCVLDLPTCSCCADRLCPARRHGLWSHVLVSEDGKLDGPSVVGSNPMWKYGYLDAGVSMEDFLCVGDALKSCSVVEDVSEVVRRSSRQEPPLGHHCVGSKVLRVEVTRRPHLGQAGPRRLVRRQKAGGLQIAKTEFYEWWLKTEAAKREIFRENCRGNFDAAIDYDSGDVVYEYSALTALTQSTARKRRFLHPLPHQAKEKFLRDSARVRCMCREALRASISDVSEVVKLQKGLAVLKLHTNVPAGLEDKSKSHESLQLKGTHPSSTFSVDAEYIRANQKWTQRNCYTDTALEDKLAGQMKIFDAARTRERSKCSEHFQRRWIADLRAFLESAQLERAWQEGSGEGLLIEETNRGVPVSYVNSLMRLDRVDSASVAVKRGRLKNWDKEKIFQLFHERSRPHVLMIRFNKENHRRPPSQGDDC